MHDQRAYGTVDDQEGRHVRQQVRSQDEGYRGCQKLDDEDLVFYILAGLDSDFDPVISVVSARVEVITVGELYG
jgi:hypothetical protein